MDLLATLKNKIDALPDGQHAAGLAAVLLHIETAFKHLSRGETTGEDTAFTDAIYRTNQAFEGSVKEAYRVLAEQPPGRKTIFEIERYLETEQVFRVRVLSQFTNYRTNWRNPSTHDYQLDFDESEAFLAIISVTAFACLLLDQIIEKLSFEESRSETRASIEAGISGIVQNNIDPLQNVKAAMLGFIQGINSGSPRLSMRSEAQFVGSLAGYLSSAIPNVHIEKERRLSKESYQTADLFISLASKEIAIEVKRTQAVTNSGVYAALNQLDGYLQVSGADNGVLLFFTPEDIEYQSEQVILPVSKKTALIIRPNWQDVSD